MPTDLLLMRHGETAWNRGKIFRGTHDVPLNDNGRAQAAALAEALRDRPIDAAYTSGLSRARETAEIVLAGRNVTAIIEDGLCDFDYGQWTGLADAEVARRRPEQHRLWTTDPEQARIPGGDTLRGVFERAVSVMGNIAADHDGDTVALFAHRVVNKLLVLRALGLPLSRFNFIRQDNCCVNEFQYVRGDYVIQTINDVSHVRRSGAGLLAADF